MKCLILAAGYATRLYPLTKCFPKPLLKVGNKAILDWLVDDIDSTGVVDEYIVVSNHLFAGQFRDWAAGRPQRIRIVDDGTISNETRLGAVLDIQLALQDNVDDVLVMAGDNLLDFSLDGFIRFFQDKQASCVMTHEENDLARQQRTAIICFDQDRRITDYEEKPRQPRGRYAVPPFYIYRAQDAARIAEALAAGCGYDAPGSFAAWLSGKAPLYAYEMPGKRYDIGDAASYELVQKEYEGIASNGEV